MNNTWFVTCEDGLVRHGDVEFNSLAEAMVWAQWGHLCTNTHEFTELFPDRTVRAISVHPKPDPFDQSTWPG